MLVVKGTSAAADPPRSGTVVTDRPAEQVAPLGTREVSVAVPTPSGVEAAPCLTREAAAAADLATGQGREELTGAVSSRTRAPAVTGVGSGAAPSSAAVDVAPVLVAGDEPLTPSRGHGPGSTPSPMPTLPPPPPSPTGVGSTGGTSVSAGQHGPHEHGLPSAVLPADHATLFAGSPVAPGGAVAARVVGGTHDSGMQPD
ncbi:hypothetical protein O2W14_13510 [Modestobacter sp. VKM Ac-2986]|uniref:hypothetical protein n=1 Tax=Modestobacter sp. VKM Ac-2986 TaxID=3004140 RepID=UPI0022AB5FC8|nr:hypothetical protein [Modestobacter sp. VKM Ac-2986]MCZ2829855.1 hypothetical protein [Modestobacter sp. VKM Ac-2986]